MNPSLLSICDNQWLCSSFEDKFDQISHEFIDLGKNDTVFLLNMSHVSVCRGSEGTCAQQCVVPVEDYYGLMPSLSSDWLEKSLVSQLTDEPVTNI